MRAEYTVAVAVAVAAIIAWELVVLRTGLFREGRYWGTVAITLAFQVPVDGWLTRQDGAVVLYNPAAITGVRWPWHIPVEDFGFGFALITLTLLVWRRYQQSGRAEDAS